MAPAVRRPHNGRAAAGRGGPGGRTRVRTRDGYNVPSAFGPERRAATCRAVPGEDNEDWGGASVISRCDQRPANGPPANDPTLNGEGRFPNSARQPGGRARECGNQIGGPGKFASALFRTFDEVILEEYQSGARVGA